MGNIESLINLTKEQVAEYLLSVQINQDCVNIIFHQEVDGLFISSISPEDIHSLLIEIGIVSPFQRTRLAVELKKALALPKKLSPEERIENAEEEKMTEEDGTIKFVAEVSQMISGGLKNKIAFLTQSRSVEEECCSNDDGKWKSYYDYVVDEAAVEMVDPMNPHRIRDKDNHGKTLQSFLTHPSASMAKLSIAEVAVLRLYTGE
jgi:hypothetical protein